jgi:hypothetical protein
VDGQIASCGNRVLPQFVEVADELPPDHVVSFLVDIQALALQL